MEEDRLSCVGRLALLPELYTKEASLQALVMDSSHHFSPSTKDCVPYTVCHCKPFLPEAEPVGHSLTATGSVTNTVVNNRYSGAMN